ncbi:unnamed protein product [Mesocestoides corti]|uniref:Ribosomal protein L1 n=1 Tax=Mesocestoides corti TaxID=53468 RepID=A0A0R3UI81_MESCO|nr:unnamed protein product [Mesocestoides corti]
MDVIEGNLNDVTLALVTNVDYSRNTKKSLFVPNIVVSFVGKLVMPKTTIRLNLPHRPAGADVCIIVKDIKKTDYNASSNIWKQKWRRDAAKSSTTLPSVTFLPISELKLCYQSYESRRKLAATFDVFLADRRIVHHLPTNLGKAFYSHAAGKIPVPVSLGQKNLVDEVNKGLQTCLVFFSGKGTTESVVIGNTGMPKEHIRENIVAAVRGVVDKWPGGLMAIRSVYVRGVGPSVPIYFDNNDVTMKEAEKNLSELNNAKKTHHDLEDMTIAESDSQKFIAMQIKRSNSKLPLAPLLEVAESLPVTEYHLKEAFKTGPPYRKKTIKSGGSRSSGASGNPPKLKKVLLKKQKASK